MTQHANVTTISREINVSLKNKIRFAKINLSAPTVAFAWRQKRPNIANARKGMKALSATTHLERRSVSTRTVTTESAIMTLMEILSVLAKMAGKDLTAT